MPRKETESKQKSKKKANTGGPSPCELSAETTARATGAGHSDPAITLSATQVADLFEGICRGVCFLDKEGTVAHCNSRFCEITGLKLMEIVGKKLETSSLLRSEGEEDKLLGLLDEAKQAGLPLTLTSVPAWSATHEERTWELHFAPRFDQDGVYEGMGLAVEDVGDQTPSIDYADLTQHLRRIATAHEDLQEMLSEVATLLKDCSHCSFVRIEVVDRVTDLALRGETKIEQGLWDVREPLQEQTIRDIFEDNLNGASEFRTGGGSLHFRDINGVGAGLNGDLAELVSNAANSYGFRSLLLVPLRLGDRAAGFVQMATKKVDGISGSTIRAVECISVQLCTILECALQRSEMQKHRQGLIRQVQERGAHLEVQNERLRREIIERQAGQEALRMQLRLAEQLVGANDRHGDNEEKYGALFKQTASPIMAIDGNGNYVDGNDAALQFLECARDELLSMNVKDTLPPYLDEEWLNRLRVIWETGGSVERDYYVWGKIKVLEMTVTPLQVGGQRVVFEIGKDVTGRKQEEQAFRKECERISGIVGNVLDVIWAIDIGMEITYISPSVRYLLGRSAAEVVNLYNNKSLTAEIVGISEGDFQSFVRAVQGIISNPSRTQTLEFGLRHRDGFTYWVEAKMSVMRDKRGQPAGVLGVVRDISQQKKTMERRISADRLASLSEMAAGLAHEVNNPLTAVMGFAFLLQQNQSVPAEMRKDVDAIYREGKRAAEVIKSFLLFAREQKPSRQAIYVNDIIEAVLRLQSGQLETKNIEVFAKLADDLPAIQGDISQLQQAILNIVLNAEYFMFRAHQRGRLSVSTELADGKVRISIEDDGPGIPSGELNRIFDPFYTTKDVGEGMGLGLSICHGIVRGHGGDVYAESKPEGGAILTVELPTRK